MADVDAAALPTNSNQPRFVRSIPRGALLVAMGCVAMTAHYYAGAMTFLLIGWLAIISGVLELIESSRAADTHKLRSAYLSGEISILVGVLLLSVPALVLRGVTILLATSFAIDGLGKLGTAFFAKQKNVSWTWLAIGGIVNLALAAALLTRWPFADWSMVGIVVGIRMITSGWSLIQGRTLAQSLDDAAPDVHADVRLKLPPSPVIQEFNESIAANEASRRSVDFGWCLVFLIVFLAIHIGRMQVYWNLIGLIAPIVAVLGDFAVAMAVSFLLILPVLLAWRSVTRPFERLAWNRELARAPESRSGIFVRLRRWWLTRRLRFSRRVTAMRHSPTTAVFWGLKVGLPITAVWISIQSLFGLNYFFNSENWTSLVWHRWAETRTDIWREAMIHAVQDRHKDIPAAELFRVAPAGIGGKDDFSFLVVGDTGDGSSAQQSLRDQYALLGQRPDMKFLIVSSDVIYPDGAMRDYEHNFHLPFKGFTRPIYAIPGNHDWYDALEGFAANFLEADSARECMIARVETDRRLTTTTEARIDRYIQEADVLKRQYNIDTGKQHGPMFEIQTDDFAVIAVDTGVLKTVDGAQWKWFRSALDRAHGKFTMVILGHPLFTAGHYQGDPKALAGEWSSLNFAQADDAGEVASFTAIHHLLREHEVDVVMAGDMHLFEHYLEPYESNGRTRAMHHFVNGGGGAFICVGVPFDFPKHPATKVWTYFPSKSSVTEKLDEQTPLWKMPLWLWVKHLSGWPFNGYIMSAAFDHNRAPFFQSFVEIQVRRSTNEVAFLPRGAGGRLRWRELENHAAIIPPGKTEDDFVEFIVPMRR